MDSKDGKQNQTGTCEAKISVAFSDEQGSAKVRQLFENTFGYETHRVYKAAGRVNIIGEHVDYNCGVCLPIAIAQSTFIAVAKRTDKLIRVVSAQEETVREIKLDQVGPVGTDKQVQGWISYVAGVFWACEQLGVAQQLSGADIAIDSCVPYGAGLSSSAALECAVATYIADEIGLDIYGDSADEHRAKLAQVCVKAENEVAGAPTGGMDQSASLRCKKDHAIALDCKDFSVELVPFELSANQMEILIVDTKAKHQLVDGQYAKRRSSCMEAAEILQVSSLREIPVDQLQQALDKLVTQEQKNRVRHVVTEIDRTQRFIDIMRNNDYYDEKVKHQLGELLLQSHISLRDDYEVSCKELDIAVDAMMSAGAWGARMTGGGFGGCAIALIESSQREQIAEAVLNAFAENNLHEPVLMIATASSGATKI